MLNCTLRFDEKNRAYLRARRKLIYNQEVELCTIFFMSNHKVQFYIQQIKETEITKAATASGINLNGVGNCISQNLSKKS